MSTITCACGKAFSDAEIPCPYRYHLISDDSLGEMVRRIVELVRQDADAVAIYSEIEGGAAETYKCPHCGRLLVYGDQPGAPAKVYVAEHEP